MRGRCPETLTMATVAPRLPRKLFKYKPFGVNTLRILGETEVREPVAFNDPFDCSPTVRVDVERLKVGRLWKHLRLKVVGREQAVSDLSNHRYMSMTTPR
jgi:hypothetical protein